MDAAVAATNDAIIATAAASTQFCPIVTPKFVSCSPPPQARDTAAKAEGRARSARAAAAELRERLKASEAEVAKLRLQLAQRLRPRRAAVPGKALAAVGLGEGNRAVQQRQR